MLKPIKPEIDGKYSFRDEMNISIETSFPIDNSTILKRLELDDSETKYTKDMKPKYKFTKHYCNINKDALVMERVFYISETNRWIGIADSKYGTFHLYKRMLSKYPSLKKSNLDVGIFYRYSTEQIVVYTTDDNKEKLDQVEWIFNNPENVKEFMVQMKEMYLTDKYPFMNAFYLNKNEDTSLILV